MWEIGKERAREGGGNQNSPSFSSSSAISSSVAVVDFSSALSTSFVAEASVTVVLTAVGAGVPAFFFEALLAAFFFVVFDDEDVVSTSADALASMLFCEELDSVATGAWVLASSASFFEKSFLMSSSVMATPVTASLNVPGDPAMQYAEPSGYRMNLPDTSKWHRSPLCELM